MNEAQPPLSGVTVVTMEQAVSAPLASRQLADLGARVIKVERPDGGDFARSYDEVVHGTSAFFVWCNRGKESVALDVKSPQGREALDRLVRMADVFISNLAPGAADRLGFGAASLTARDPRLVCCEITGYGQGGPLADRKAYDLVIQAEAGVFEVTGNGDDRARAGISIADIASGMYAFSGVLAALFRRATTGRGGVVRISMLDALADWMGAPLLHFRHGGVAPRRTGTHHATIAPYGTFRAHDGAVMIAVQNEAEWRRLCEAFDRQDLLADPRFATNAGRAAASQELQEQLERSFATQSVSAIREVLDRAGIANSVASGLGDVLEHPQLAARNRWTTVDVNHAPVTVLRQPIEFDDVDSSPGAVPALGEHTASVLQELGYREDELPSFGVTPA